MEATPCPGTARGASLLPICLPSGEKRPDTPGAITLVTWPPKADAVTFASAVMGCRGASRRISVTVPCHGTSVAAPCPGESEENRPQALEACVAAVNHHDASIGANMLLQKDSRREDGNVSVRAGRRSFYQMQRRIPRSLQLDVSEIFLS